MGNGSGARNHGERSTQCANSMRVAQGAAVHFWSMLWWVSCDLPPPPKKNHHRRVKRSGTSLVVASLPLGLLPFITIQTENSHQKWHAWFLDLYGFVFALSLLSPSVSCFERYYANVFRLCVRDCKIQRLSSIIRGRWGRVH